MGKTGNWMNHLALAALMALPVGAQAEEPPQVVAVAKLAAAPVVDGKAAEWGGEGWQTIKVTPAVADDKDNNTGTLEVQLKAGVAGDRFFLAVRWPDGDESLTYKPWKWQGAKYKRGKERDDMFAVRFHLAGDYDRTMLSKKSYQVDLWQWSAGRSNQSGLAEDYTHFISNKEQESAAEYELKEGGMVYIRKVRDEGKPPYDNNEINEKENKGDEVPGIVFQPDAGGSVADVQAKGVWATGGWTLEFSRAVNTSHPEDRVFAKGDKVLGQIAVFNKAYAEHKSVSEPLLFDFSAAF